MKKQLILFACLVFLTAGIEDINATTYTVCSSGCNYSTIQGAVNAASPGDSIEVWSGTYVENVEVNKQLDIYSRDGGPVTTVVASDPLDHVFEVTANNTNISGFTVTGVSALDKGGIYLEETHDNKISNNIVMDNGYGIYLLSSNYATLSNNTVTSNENDGIRLAYSSNIVAIDNNASYGNFRGICLFETNDSTIENNLANSNVMCGFGIWYSNNNIINNNTANYHTGFGGIRLCSHANNNSITNNVFDSNHIGISIEGSSNNNILKNNNFSSNYFYGILLDGVVNNLMYYNNIIDNANQASDTNPTNNDWHHPTLLEGNYWSDYTGIDDGSGTGKHAIANDGIGDTLIPHPLLGYDFYPFMNPNGWIKTKVMATIDIDPVTLKLNSGGKWITAYIELLEGYDVEDINASTVQLNGVQAVTDPKYDFVTNQSEYITDKDEDGILKRMVKFDRSAVVALLSPGDEVKLMVSGELTDRTTFEGSDTIKVREKKPKKK